mgnify:CR=1 FL=1
MCGALCLHCPRKSPTHSSVIKSQLGAQLEPVPPLAAPPIVSIHSHYAMCLCDDCGDTQPGRVIRIVHGVAMYSYVITLL